MSFSDNTSDSDWKETKMKDVKTIKEEPNGSQNSKIKYNQKFCDKWINVFNPWLARCKDDPYKPFCRACQCSLDCNRCHLQRHERTRKHQRNLEILINKGEVAARQNLNLRQERTKYYHQRKKMATERNASESFNDGDVDTADDGVEENNIYEPHSFQFVKTGTGNIGSNMEEHLLKNGDILNTLKECKQKQTPQKTDSTPSVTSLPMQNLAATETTPNYSASHKNTVNKTRGLKLLMQIQKDKTELMESFKELMANSACSTQIPMPTKDKHSVDLFFESVSTSVKQFPPNLISEAKLRVSQLICELEMRGMTAPTTHTISTNSSSSGVAVPAAAMHAYMATQQASTSRRNYNGSTSISETGLAASVQEKDETVT